jgi:hypothetical protein
MTQALYAHMNNKKKKSGPFTSSILFHNEQFSLERVKHKT